jgi:hypothetical protein
MTTELQLRKFYEGLGRAFPYYSQKKLRNLQKASEKPGLKT